MEHSAAGCARAWQEELADAHHSDHSSCRHPDGSPLVLTMTYQGPCGPPAGLYQACSMAPSHGCIPIPVTVSTLTAGPSPMYLSWSP